MKAPANLVEAFAVARQHGDKEFLIYEGERRSFNQLMDEADAIAAALQAHGVRPGSAWHWPCATTRNGWPFSSRSPA